MTEVEAKLIARDAGQVRAVLEVLQAAGYDVRPGEIITQLDSYYDTANWAVYRAGYAYRCRQRGESGQLTLKATGNSEKGCFEREEIEQALPDQPGTELPPGPVADRLRTMTSGDRLRKLFSVRTRRQTWQLRSPGAVDSRIELDCDECTIRAYRPSKLAPGHFDFSEIELELECGDASVVEDAARLLEDRVGLVPSQMSKFERGLLAGGLTLPADEVQEDEPRLTRSDSLIDLLFRFLSRQFRVLKSQEKIAWEGIDPEGVHRMRVSMRRIRALLRDSRDLLAAEPVGRLESEFRWLSKQLGHARDTDICLEEIPTFERLLPPEGLAAAEIYEHHLLNERYGAYSNLAKALASQRYADLKADFDRLLSDGPGDTTRREFGGLSIAAAADGRIRTLADKTIKRGDALDAASPAEELHRLRILAKRLRYLIEFFAAIQTRKWRKPIAALQDLHDILGTHQDAVTSHARLSAFLDSVERAATSPEVVTGLERLLLYEAGRITDCRQRFPEAWSRLRSCFE